LFTCYFVSASEFSEEETEEKLDETSILVGGTVTTHLPLLAVQKIARIVCFQ